MSNFQLPGAEALKELFDMVVGGDTEVSEAGAIEIDQFSHVAHFVDDGDQLVGLCYASLPLSAGLGAALSLIPPDAAEDMVKESALTPVASDNLYEVMNMLSSLYMNDASDHLRLTVVEPSSGAPEGCDLAALARIDYQVDAGRYGGGQIAFLSA